jgi:hypothetical protein
VTSIPEIDDYTDEQLSKIFANGTAEIPGADTKDKYQFCKGRTLINSWTKGGERPETTCLLLPVVWCLKRSVSTAVMPRCPYALAVCCVTVVK